MSTHEDDGDRSLPRDTVDRAVRAMQPAWRVTDATLADDGHMAVYHVGLDHEGDDHGAAATATETVTETATATETVTETATATETALETQTATERKGGTGQCPDSAVLKATPSGIDGGVGMVTEPRLLALLDRETSIPTPAVYGVVDDDPDLPTPCFLMETVDDSQHVTDQRALGDDAIETLARRTGRYLAELHDLDIVDRFGQVGWTGEGTTLQGAPSVDLTSFAVVDGRDSWPDQLEAWIDLELEHIPETRFADIADELDAELATRFDALDSPAGRNGDGGDDDVGSAAGNGARNGAFEPVLARIDHGLHNVVLDDADGAVAAVIDWAFTLAATRGYDLAVVSHVLHGDLHSYRTDTPTRRDLVTDALLEGYQDVAGHVPADYRANRECYEFLAVVRAMNHFDHILDDDKPAIRDDIADGLRAHARTYS